MIGVGIDTVEIKRFAGWHSKPIRSLLRVFKPNEIAYCCEHESVSVERFAVRFAAREALFKALQPILTRPIPFLTLCKAVELSKMTGGSPVLRVDWRIVEPYAIQRNLNEYKVMCSLTHTHHCATAIVIIS